MRLRNQDGKYVVVDGADRYKETCQAMPTSSLLARSSDHGYWAVYVGYGTIDGVPVKAIYLLDYDQAEIEDEGNYDWDRALANGYIAIDFDRLSDLHYDIWLDKIKRSHGEDVIFGDYPVGL